ncbi:hypothetical protein BG011_001199 [Mortierella polycephala]|uniref:HIG1 domain-containing protein n=1 Tax=Mortierella polycephala TaxID=41804 RepID=A0A9P6QHI7_9FUNG|nr:hypothetical protein BG011_001199 [Mortierella polycephala]
MARSDEFKNPLVDSGEDKNQLVAIAAAKGAGLALVTGGLVAFSGPRYSQTYRALSRPMKTFLLGTGTAATAVLFGDYARVHYEDRQLLRHLDDEAAEAKRAEIRAQRGWMAEMNYQVRENRNMVVGVAWLACMAGSLGYTFSKRGLTTTQRIVTARMYAQGFTILTMMAVAAIELTDVPAPKKEIITDQWKAILAKDNQGNYIIKDNAGSNAMAAASLSSSSAASTA